MLSELRQALLCMQHLVASCTGETPMQRLELLIQLMFGLDHQFRRGGRRRSAQIGNEIDDREIRLMPNSRYHRQLRSRDRSRHRFVVERREVFKRATATRDYDDVHVALAVEI